MIIDKIFIINLKSRTDRLENIKLLIDHLNFDKKKIEIFEAVVGKDISKDEINKILSISSLDTLYNYPSNHKDIRSKGAIGCYLSHYKIWEKIINQKLDNVLIIEDDIFTDIDSEEFNKYINSIPNDYDIGMLSWFKLWFDPLNNPNKNVIINKYWNKYNSINVFSTGCYLISKKGAEKLIKNAFPICYQVDAYMNILNNVDKDFVRYISKESLLTQKDLGTDIQARCNRCDITEKINQLYNKKNNIETFGNINNIETFVNNNKSEKNIVEIILILIIIIIFVKNI
jgi:GR25 family glycosyltransferase involved in LPS biosynthesis